MTPKPRILDLFCGGGGAAQGYLDAGFDVVGVDIEPQKNYPGRFIQADITELMTLPWFPPMISAVHASPPCQGYSLMRHAPGALGAPKLIRGVRHWLTTHQLPYVIENVEGAMSEMVNPTMLCGSMFGLGADVDGEFYQLRRHRLFETNWELISPMCDHRGPVIGIYGGHARCRSAAYGGRGTTDFDGEDRVSLAHKAMDMKHKLPLKSLSEAIPPAYTKFIGEQLMKII